MADATHAIPDPQPQQKHIDGPIGLPPVPQHHDPTNGAPDGVGDEMLNNPGEANELRMVYDTGAEQGLAALRDSPPGVKPYYPYSTLIRYAIKGAPGQRLLLEDIYYAIEQRFPYFKTAPAGWKNSVRHNLSLNPCFEKISRPLTDRGKGAYWTVNDKIDPRAGVHRDRKKKRKGDKSSSGGGGGGGSRRRRGGDDESDSARESPEMDTVNSGGANGAGGPGAPGAVPGMQPGVIMDENGNRIAFAAWPGSYGAPGMYPGMGAGPRYILDPHEEEHGPEFDDSGNPIWRTVWLNELVKLRRATYEQDTTTGDPDWYHAMVERVRAAFLQPEQTYMQAPEEGEEHGEGEEAES